MKRLTNVENFFISKPTTCKYKIWYNVDETILDEILIAEIAASVVRMQNHITKIAFIGMGYFQKKKFARKLKLEVDYSPFPYSYFSDAEKAKEWLV